MLYIQYIMSYNKTFLLTHVLLTLWSSSSTAGHSAFCFLFVCFVCIVVLFEAVSGGKGKFSCE